MGENGRQVFGEGVLFALYKDYPFGTAREIKSVMYKKYGIKVSYDLICAITNYQIKKYGSTLQKGNLFAVNTWTKHRSAHNIAHERIMQQLEGQTEKVIKNSEGRFKRNEK